MNKISVLQLGTKNWSDIYKFPEGVEFHYKEAFKQTPEKMYDVVFIDRILSEEEIKLLSPVTKAYTLFFTEQVTMTPAMELYSKFCRGQNILLENIQQFLEEELQLYFPKSYGEKYRHNALAVSQNYQGDVVWNGNCDACVNGIYGENYTQVFYWRNNIPIYKGQLIDLWLEYEKDESVSILFKITLLEQGTIGNIVRSQEFDENQLKHLITIESGDKDLLLFVSVCAKGKGRLKITALHDRYSRKDKGYFIPGGERYVTSKREELFCYFEPGDLKPPLNVYFSGYKTKEGFEGYYMMKKMGCPFLLISEARLEGGAFYMGTEEYENMIVQCIRKYMKELGFQSNQVILSGMSMGTSGTLYYGCDICPHAMILGKPLASLGDVAINEKRFRPGGFPTSLDLLTYICGSSNEDAAEKLNKKFWDKFGAADWSNSKFIAAYMLEDDYDATAYESIIMNLQSAGVQIYGKGIHGRHNDNTGAIVSWFESQYDKILHEDFARRIDR
ncbi:MAG: accessory Sec system protein Asp2 [Eubacteriales bacterium]|nr:accessory Sec system protein Asp2 [Eubacteriales bacterium]